MGRDYINIKTLTLDELAGVVTLYPWYGAARKELSVRMSKLGGDDWGKNQYSDAALYVGNRKVISDLFRPKDGDYSDKDLESLLRRYIREENVEQAEPKAPVRIAGGDFFSKAQYEQVRREEDNVFSRFAAKARSEAEGRRGDEIGDEFCTETLAQIYIDQGYYEQAKSIYSRLILKFPEKNAYFASLIRKLEAGQN